MINEIVFLKFYWNVWLSELLYFNNPVIRNVSLLASLNLMVEQMRMGKVLSIAKLTLESTNFFFLISDWATRNADNAVFPSAGWNMFFEFFPIFENDVTVNALSIVRSNVRMKFVLWSAHFEADFAFKSSSIVNINFSIDITTENITKKVSWHGKVTWFQWIVEFEWFWKLCWFIGNSFLDSRLKWCEWNDSGRFNILILFHDKVFVDFKTFLIKKSLYSRKWALESNRIFWNNQLGRTNYQMDIYDWLPRVCYQPFQRRFFAKSGTWIFSDCRKELKKMCAGARVSAKFKIG